MKKPLFVLVILSLLLPLGASAAVSPQPGDFNGCPASGNSSENAALNRLKNRSTQFVGARRMTAAEINALPTSPTSKVTEWQSHMVFVEGFLVAIKQQGKESTNCGGTGAAMTDNHLWLVDSADQVDLTNAQTIRKSKAAATVVEITPRWRAANPGWKLANIQKHIDEKAKFRITGWLMLDPEHPDQIGQTRGGLWELHPITKIEFLNGETWVEL